EHLLWKKTPGTDRRLYDSALSILDGCAHSPALPHHNPNPLLLPNLPNPPRPPALRPPIPHHPLPAHPPPPHHPPPPTLPTPPLPQTPPHPPRHHALRPQILHQPLRVIPPHRNQQPPRSLRIIQQILHLRRDRPLHPHRARHKLPVVLQPSRNRPLPRVLH